jgi:Ca-activated chloride channel homolog
MNGKRIIWMVFLLASAMSGFGQKENKHIRSGNRSFAENDFKQAELDYMRALESKPDSYKGQYNLGGALYKQGNYEDASKIYNSLTYGNRPEKVKADAYYNLGNSLVHSQQYAEGIEAYKNALRLNPNDPDAKYNMEYAKRMLQEQQDKQQGQDDKNEEQQDQGDDNQEDSGQEDQQQEQQQQQEQEQQQQQQQQQQEQQMSKKEAERMLEALKNEEHNTLEKIMLQEMVQGQRVQMEKDW